MLDGKKKLQPRTEDYYSIPVDTDGKTRQCCVGDFLLLFK